MKTQTERETQMTLRVSIDGDFYNDEIKAAVKAALESEKVDFDCEVEVIIADEQTIRELNNETRGIDRVTDVLSFPMFDDVCDAEPEADGFVFLGSMVICEKRALEQAGEYGHSPVREVSFLAVHSILHLLGYDHELGEDEEREMFAKQEAVLSKMGITR